MKTITIPGILALLALAGCGSEQSAENSYDNAKQAVADGDLITAVLEYKNALQQSPDLAVARLQLGNVYLSLGMADEAKKELERAGRLGRLAPEDVDIALARVEISKREYTQALERLAPYGADVGADLHWARGLANLGQNHEGRAREAFAAALKAEPDHRRTLLELARLEFADADYAAAEQRLAGIIATHPSDAEAWMLRGEIANVNDDSEGMFQAFTEARAGAPAGSLLRASCDLALARYHLVSGDLDATTTHINAIARYYPDHPVVDLLRGRVAYVAGDLEQADLHLLEVLRKAPSHVAALRLLGLIKHKTGDLEQAQYYLHLSLNLSDELSPEVRKLVAVIELQQGDFVEATEVLTPLVEANSADSQVLTLLGRAELLAGNFDAAYQWLERAAPAGADSAAAQRARRGLSLLTRGDTQAAIAELESAMAEDSDNTASDRYLVFAHIAQRNYDKALEIAQGLSKKRPYDPVPHFMVGNVQSHLGDSQAAQEAFERARQIDPDFAPAAMELARLAMAAGSIDKAGALFEEVLASDSANAAALRGMADVAIRQGDTARALNIYEKVRDLDPSDVNVRLALADHYLAERRFEEALAVAREAFAIDESNARAMHTLVRVHAESTGGSEGADAIKRFMATNPNSQSAVLRLAQAQFELGDFEGAFKSVQKNLARDKNDTASQVAMATVQLERGQPQQALALAKAVAKSNPDLTAPYPVLMEAALELKLYDEAVAAAERLVKLQPDNLNSTFLLVYALEAAGKIDTARTTLDTIIREHPTNIAAQMNLARLEEASGEIALAEQIYRKIFDADPSVSQAALGLARLADRGEGNGDAGIAELEKTRGLNPNAVEARLILARRYLRLRRIADAEPVVEELLQLRPVNPRILEIAVATKIFARQFSDGQSLAQRWVEVEPNNANAVQQLAVCYLVQGERSIARTYLNQALELDGENTSAMFTLANLLTAEGKQGEALTIVNRILRVDPESVPALAMKADLLWDLNIRDEALGMYTTVHQSEPSANSALKLATALWATGKRDQSKSVLDDWLKQNGDDRALRITLADFYYAEGERDKALTEYEKLAAVGDTEGLLLNRLAWIYHESGDARAEETARRAYEKAPDDPNVLDTLGWILVNSNKVEHGVSLLQQAATKKNNDTKSADGKTLHFHLATGLARAGRTGQAKNILTKVLADGREFPERARARTMLDSLP